MAPLAFCFRAMAAPCAPVTVLSAPVRVEALSGTFLWSNPHRGRPICTADGEGKAGKRATGASDTLLVVIFGLRAVPLLDVLVLLLEVLGWSIILALCRARPNGRSGGPRSDPRTSNRCSE